MLAFSLSLFLSSYVSSFDPHHLLRCAELSSLIVPLSLFPSAVSICTSVENFAILLAIQNAIPSTSSLIRDLIPSSSRRLTLPASPPFYHPDLLLSFPHSSDLISISYAASPRIQNSSRYLQPRAIVSSSPGMAYLRIHTKKLCV